MVDDFSSLCSAVILTVDAVTLYCLFNDREQGTV